MVDGDEQLAERTGGRTAADVAASEGLDAVHDLEADIALAVLASSDPAVIGPAASVCESAVVRDHLADHVVVWLTGPVELLAEKAVEKDHRPLVHEHDPAALAANRSARRPRTASSWALDPLVIDVSTTDDEAAAELIVAFARERGTPA